jgi:hypothetical protein
MANMNQPNSRARASREGDRIRKWIFPRKPLWDIVNAICDKRGISNSSYIMEAVANKLGRPDLA